MRDTTAVVAAAVLGISAAPATAASTTPEVRRAEIRVGIEEGDLRGSDHRALQAAVDYVAGLGGGTVYIGPGRYLMRTVLVAADGAKSRLAADGDCNERQITLADPTGFHLGDGVVIGDDSQGGGFGVTTATLTSQVDPTTFRISNPLYFDYMVSQHAWARRAFPVIGGWQIKDAAIEGVTIVGNRAKSEPMDGCRGGGIYLFECEDVTIRHCTVRDYNGDGISFQVSRHVTVEDCLSENNAGLGLHPGSGSQEPVLRSNHSIGNGGDGLYVCWRVKHGLFEKNEIRDNKGAGISIGHKDTDNLFRNNTITGNGKVGVLFRPESEAMGAHRNTFEQNVILDNGAAQSDEPESPAVLIRGPHHDLVFRQNTIGRSQPSSTAGPGIRQSKDASGLKEDKNRFLHVKTPVEVSK
jgi:parallel beta-helix repeat protein